VRTAARRGRLAVRFFDQLEIFARRRRGFVDRAGHSTIFKRLSDPVAQAAGISAGPGSMCNSFTIADTNAATMARSMDESDAPFISQCVGGANIIDVPSAVAKRRWADAAESSACILAGLVFTRPPRARGS
jgi:hypothetical protein